MLGLCGWVLIVRGKSCQKFCTYPTRIMPAGFRMDLPLAKAQDIRNSKTNSLIIHLGRGEKKNVVFAQK